MQRMDIQLEADLVVVKPEEALGQCDIEIPQFKIENDEDDNMSSKIHSVLKSNPGMSSKTTTKHKDIVLLKDFLFYIRIFVLILSMFLLFLSCSYCIAQFIDVRLIIWRKCDGPKKREEIWHRAYEKYIENDQVMSSESQHGLNGACWTTQKIVPDITSLWYSNNYEYEWKSFKSSVNAESVFFGLLSIFVIIVIFYNIITLVIDGIAITQNKLYLKSTSYNKGVEDNKQKKTDVPKKEMVTNQTMKQKLIKFVKEMHNEYLVDGTSGWMLMKFVSELMEFILQSQALFLYNGYNVFDPNNAKTVYLANKAQFIIAFASVLSFNCVTSGVLWILYALIPNHCHGLLFDRCIFFVDKFSDLMYTLFPFYIVLMDKYNDNTNIWVLLGQLKFFNEPIAFLAAFIPLLFLSAKCLMLIISSRRETVDKSFEKWKALTGSSGHNSFTSKKSKNKTKISWINKSKNKTKILKQTLVALIGLSFMAYAIYILTFTTSFMTSSVKYCASISETKYVINATFLQNLTLSETETQLLSNNPELYLWDKCVYKVYPFVNDDGIPCQCRVFLGDFNDLKFTEDERKTYFNLSEEKILSGALTHWNMLEKFSIIGNRRKAVSLKKSMFSAIHMKAFKWSDIFMSSFENGIAAWKQLEFLLIMNSQLMTPEFPEEDFSSLESISYLRFHNTNLPLHDISDIICSLKKLEFINIGMEFHFQSLPHCIDQLTELQVIHMDFTGIRAIPLSIFNLPNLVELSLFNSDIDFNETLHYNNISIDINDTDELNAWFNDNFQFNDTTDYWIQYNPICDEIEFLPTKLQHIINETTCTHPCDESKHEGDKQLQFEYCTPRVVGDGTCSDGCTHAACNWDNGDCVQLCFAAELTNCTYDLLTNDQCDPGCNNDFCQSYEVSSDFTKPDRTDAFKTADLFHCNATNFYNFSVEECSLSSSIYVDKNLAADQYDNCQEQWIGNNICDDTCRTYQCLNDGGDCDEANACKASSMCNYIFLIWNTLAIELPQTYKANHSYVCSTIWQAAVDTLQSDHDASDCMPILKEEDYNHDGYTNFREFQAMLSYFPIIESFNVPDSWGQKWSRQINCSECIGIENYNV